MKLAVLVPTVNRAGMLIPLAANIHQTTDSAHRIYFVLEDWDDDSIQAAGSTDGTLVIGAYDSNAAAVNAGYHASTEPFVAILNDDVRCTPGWDTAALNHMSDRTHIVGINQGGDEKCTSFSMVRRAYIEQHSGVYDQPDTLYHEYISQFPDTEFAEYAQARGVWEAATDSLVEHLHWVFGKADSNHPNYAKARDTYAADHAVYQARRPHFA